MLDLTPFGFTPTESNVYRTLLDLGPSSGYAVARSLSIARANAYQALDGLLAKGAAVLVEQTAPKRYRAIQPRTLFAHVQSVESRKLDDLERAVLDQRREGAAPHLYLRGARALLDVAVRAIVRSQEPVRCVTTASRLEPLTPALRARQAAKRDTRLWVAGEAGHDPGGLAQPIDPERLLAVAGPEALLLVADGALAASLDDDAEGVWSESRLHVGLVTAAIAHITGFQPTG